MFLMVYWGDNPDSDEKKKQRVGETLRRKKAERMGIVLEGGTLDVPDPPEDGGSTVVAQELFLAQQDELRILKHLMLQQGKVLEKILEKQDNIPQYEVIQVPAGTQEVQQVKAEKMDMPVFNEDISVCVIDKTGIEVSGGVVGKNQSEGENISDRIKKLRELKKNKKE